MSIGQVTISAADWIASRVTDRMALVAAGQNSALAQQTGAVSVQPVDESTGAQLERRDRERAMLAAQESYKRVAQRIKSRLTNPARTEETRPEANQTAERATMLEGLRDSPRVMTTLLAAEQRVEAITANTPASSSAGGATRADPIFGLVEAEQKKALDRQAASVEEKEKEAGAEAVRKEIEDRQRREALQSRPAFEDGIWDDLFELPDSTPYR